MTLPMDKYNINIGNLFDILCDKIINIYNQNDIEKLFDYAVKIKNINLAYKDIYHINIYYIKHNKMDLRTIDEVPENYFNHLPKHSKKNNCYKYMAIGVGLILTGFMLKSFINRNSPPNIFKYYIARPNGLYNS